MAEASESRVDKALEQWREAIGAKGSFSEVNAFIDGFNAAVAELMVEYAPQPRPIEEAGPAHNHPLPWKHKFCPACEYEVAPPPVPPMEAATQWICEDELPPDYPYHKMFPHSKLGQDGLGGVRIFPAVEPASKEIACGAAPTNYEMLCVERYHRIQELERAVNALVTLLRAKCTDAQWAKLEMKFDPEAQTAEQLAAQRWLRGNRGIRPEEVVQGYALDELLADFAGSRRSGKGAGE